MIYLDGVSKYYGSFKAIDNVSFTVNTGEIVGLLGPNGAGKTTLMKIITGYHNAHSGNVEVCNINIMEDPVSVKKHIGYLPETNPIYEDLFVYEYLQFIASARGIAQQDIKKAIDTVVDLCALSEFVYKPITNLSKGMRQRVGLAQAIIHNPDVIILDEPTSGLDPNQIKEIRSVIRNLGKTKTVILSTHILQEVEALCSRILIVNKGNIVAEGTDVEIANKLKGGDVYSLSLVGDISHFILDTLTEVSGVEKIAKETQEGDSPFTKVIVSGGSQSLDGENIFDWAVSKQLRIKELYKKSASLEAVFESITNDAQESNIEGGSL